MDTLIQIQVGANNGGVTSDSLNEIYQLYDSLADNTQSHSGVKNVYDINQTNDPVVVKQELYDLLKFAYTMKAKTNGYFNPLIGGLSDLWKKDLFNIDASGASATSSSETFTPSVPTDAEVQNELTKMNASSLVFDDSALSVQRVGEGKIDLGGVAKGYAGQVVYSTLKKAGVSQFLLNAGTSTLALGESTASDGYYKLQFSDLSGRYAKVKDCVVGTSSISEQNATVNGQIYSHIINPLTGSALVDWHGTVIVGQDAGTLDVLSTSFVLMGPDLSAPFLTEYGLSAIFYKDGVDTIVNKGLTLYAS
jgi:thiamine biosynthesis lipoprotein